MKVELRSLASEGIGHPKRIYARRNILVDLEISESCVVQSHL